MAYRVLGLWTYKKPRSGERGLLQSVCLFEQVGKAKGFHLFLHLFNGILHR